MCESFDSGDEVWRRANNDKKSRFGEKVKLFSAKQRGPWENGLVFR